LSVENRFELMRHLHVRSADQIVHGAARRVARMDGNYIVDVNTTAYSFKIKTKSVIVATGRFGSLSCDFDALLLPWSYRRIEVGLRIEQPAGEFFLRDDPYLDSKYVCMSQSGDINWRTFCCCRNGEILQTDFDGWRTLSGRADCAPSGVSNVGFNLRFLDAAVGERVWRHIASTMRGRRQLFASPLRTLIGGAGTSEVRVLDEVFGVDASTGLRQGLSQLVDDFEVSHFDDAVVYGPCVEG